MKTNTNELLFIIMILFDVKLAKEKIWLTYCENHQSGMSLCVIDFRFFSIDCLVHSTVISIAR